MRILFVFALICLVESHNISIDSQSNPSSASMLAEAVYEVVSKIFPLYTKSLNLLFAQNATSFRVQDFREELSSKVSENTNLVVRIYSDSDEAPRRSSKRNAIVMIADNFSDFLRIFRKINRRTHSFSGLFLVILTSGEIFELQDIFNLFWNIQIYNVNIMFANTERVFVTTFMPFNAISCNDTRPIIINEFSDGTYRNDVSKFFPEKLRNLFSCPVRVSVCALHCC